VTIDWLFAIVWLGGFGAFLIAAVALVRRSERRLSTGPRDQYTTVPGSDTSDQISAYLDRMSSELALPAADVAEVRSELIDHLEDSIAALEAEGFTHDEALREALGRLGPAAELGRQLRAAHQSTRRLLAGAGGGVFAAGGGFVLGYLGGTALAFVLVIVMAAGAVLLGHLGVPLPDLTSSTGGSVGNALMLSFMLAFAALFATRYAVRTCAGLSRRAPKTVASFWAAAGLILFGAWALFGIRGTQSWPGAASELCIPLAAVVGAVYRIERPMPHVGRWAAVVAVLSMVVLVGGVALMYGVSYSSSGSSGSFQESDLHLDLVAPVAPETWLPAADMVVISQNGNQTAYADLSAQLFASSGGSAPLPVAPVLANWSDLRFEAWHALPFMSDSGQLGIDTTYATPFAVQPAVLQGDSFPATFHFEHMRDARSWWVVLTGVAPDGHRYRLGDGTGNEADFNGSVWDWLTAPQ
jgi:hypothetical protein